MSVRPSAQNDASGRLQRVCAWRWLNRWTRPVARSDAYQARGTGQADGLHTRSARRTVFQRVTASRARGGLNVIIGARGTGKTSVVELIRSALGASSFSDEVSMRGSQQAVATLDGDAVTVTIAAGDERFTVKSSLARFSSWWPTAHLSRPLPRLSCDPMG